MSRYSIEPRTKKYVKGSSVLSFARIFSHKHGKKLLNTATKIGVHKTAEATVELIENKITEKVVKPEQVPDENSRNFEEMVIPTEKRQGILNVVRQIL